MNKLIPKVFYSQMCLCHHLPHVFLLYKDDLESHLLLFAEFCYGEPEYLIELRIDTIDVLLGLFLDSIEFTAHQTFAHVKLLSLIQALSLTDF